MRLVLSVAMLLLAAVLCVTPAQAAFTKALPYEDTVPMMKGLSPNGTLGVASGRLELDDAQMRGSVGVLGAQDFTVTGIQKACFRDSGSARCATGALSLNVAQGSSIGLCLPVPAVAAYDAAHVLALFSDLSTGNDLNTIPINQSLIAPAIDGELVLSPVSPIPVSGLAEDKLGFPPCTAAAAIAALDANSTLTLRNGPNVEKRFQGKDGYLLLAGDLRFPPMQSDFAVLPFGPSAEATLSRAGDNAADRGLDASRVEQMMRLLEESGSSPSSSGGASDGNVSESIQDLPTVIKRLLNGALVQIPTGGGEGSEPDPRDIHLVRFTEVRATRSGNDVHWQGSAILALQDGHVDHTHKLTGAGWFALPWWSWALWILAIGAFVARLVLHPPKQSRWDALRWIGWIATPVAIVIVFLLVDFEARRLFGASFLSGAEGKARLFFLGIDVAFMGIVGFVAGAPLRILLRNGFLLLRQGTFMGLATGIGTLLGFFLGFSYFRDYLDLVFSQVVSQLG